MTSFSHEFNHFPSRWLAAGLITETFQAIAHYGESTEMGLELQRLVPGNYFIFLGGEGAFAYKEASSCNFKIFCKHPYFIWRVWNLCLFNTWALCGQSFSDLGLILWDTWCLGGISKWTFLVYAPILRSV